MARALARSLILCQISLLVLSAVSAADGQAPSSRSRTSAAGTLFPDGTPAQPLLDGYMRPRLAPAHRFRPTAPGTGRSAR